MSVYRVVAYVLRDCPQFGLEPGYCILGLREPCDHERMDEPVHRLKTWPEFYRDVRDRIKWFELRKDDRTPRYAVGQMIELYPCAPASPKQDAPATEIVHHPSCTDETCHPRCGHVPAAQPSAEDSDGR